MDACVFSRTTGRVSLINACVCPRMCTCATAKSRALCNDSSYSGLDDRKVASFSVGPGRLIRKH